MDLQEGYSGVNNILFTLKTKESEPTLADVMISTIRHLRKMTLAVKRDQQIAKTIGRRNWDHQLVSALHDRTIGLPIDGTREVYRS